VTATVTDITDRMPTRILTYQERLACLVLAEMNLERAELCRDDQGPLREFFMMNYRQLLSCASNAK
jgi:hypothetical protein